MGSGVASRASGAGSGAGRDRGGGRYARHSDEGPDSPQQSFISPDEKTGLVSAGVRSSSGERKARHHRRPV